MDKKYKGKIYEAQVPLYGIYIYYSNDADALADMYEVDVPASYNGFCCLEHEKGNVGIHVPHNNGDIVIPTLGHEVFHAAMFVGEIVGLEPTLSANEEIAYIITWITGWVVECIDKDCKKEVKCIAKRKGSQQEKP